MDAISQSALVNLQTILDGYLPSATSPNVERDLLVIPKNIKPVGIGGYIGLHANPMDEIFGRHVSADAEISIGATNNNASLIADEINSISATLATLGRETLRGDGIYFLNLTSLSEPGNANENTRRLHLSVEYEYQQIPTEAGGTIATIDLRDYLNPTDGRADFIASLDTSTLGQLADPLVDFMPLTDPNVNVSSPSENWQYNAGQARIEQTAAVRGGGLTLNNPRKAGAQLLYVPQGRALSLANGIICSSMSTNQDDGIGFVFRWQDIDNFYYFLLSQNNNYQIFGKKIAGTFEFLTSSGISEIPDLSLSTPQRICLYCEGSTFTATLNDRVIVSGSDTDLASGEVGWLTHGNNAAFFHTLDIVRLP